MSAPAWTPGPWFVTPSPTHPEQHNVGLSSSITRGIRREPLFPGEYMLVSGICTEATANLIAAAPDLVEALDSLIEDTRAMLFGPRGVAECAEEDFYAAARAALAKAHGQ